MITSFITQIVASYKDGYLNNGYLKDGYPVTKMFTTCKDGYVITKLVSS